MDVVEPVKNSGEAARFTPSVAILFNEKSGPDQVVDIISRQHAFVQHEPLVTVDERGSTAWLLLLACETARPEQIMEMVGNRLPDYIQARLFPPSMVDAVRSSQG